MLFKQIMQVCMLMKSDISDIRDYISNSSFDTQIIDVAEKAFTIKRLFCKKDFRALGSAISIMRRKYFLRNHKIIIFD